MLTESCSAERRAKDAFFLNLPDSDSAKGRLVCIQQVWDNITCDAQRLWNGNTSSVYKNAQ